MLPDVAVLILAHAFAYAFSIMFLGRWIFGRLSPAASPPVLRARLCFGLITSLALSMSLLILFDITGIVSRSAIVFSWKTDLLVFLILLVFVVPFLFFYSFVYERRKLQIPRPSVLVMGLFMAYLFLFWKLGSFFPIVKTGSHSVFFFSEHATGRISVVGVTLSAFLSAYGAVITYGSIFFSSDYQESNIKTLQDSINQLIRKIASKKYDLHKRAPMPKQRGIIGTWFGIGSSNANSAAEEIKGWEKMLYESHVQLQAAIDLQKQRKFDRTFRGIAYKVLSVVLFCWNVIQIVSAMLNIIVHRIPDKDPITTLFLYASKVDVTLPIEAWAQPLSFIFMGISIVSSMRSFFLTLQTALVKISVFQYVPQSWMTLVVSYLMGTYALSFILLSRMSIPPLYRETLSMVLGDIEFGFYHRWRDSVFVVSAVLAIFGYGVWSIASHGAAQMYMS
eukprot:ANDGO_04794.mRNA.1 GPCR-type G protein 1